VLVYLSLCTKYATISGVDELNPAEISHRLESIQRLQMHPIWGQDKSGLENLFAKNLGIFRFALVQS